MLLWILLAVTTISVVFLWLHVGRLEEKLGTATQELEMIKSELEKRSLESSKV